MEITRTREVFTFSELSPEAQDKATELLCAEAWECLDSDMISEDLAGTFVYWATGEHPGAITTKQLGTDYRIRLYWSVSYSQSDNAQMIGVLSRDEHPNLAWPDGIHTIHVSSRNFGWSYATDVYEIDEDGGEGQYTHNAKLMEAANDFVIDLCERLYREARSLCEAHTGKNYVLDAYENCYDLTRRFTVDGEYAPYEFWASEVPA
jgi:hypothetical protein